MSEADYTTAADCLKRAQELLTSVIANSGGEAAPRRATHDLGRAEASLNKLQAYARQFPLTFTNRTVCRLFGDFLKLMPLAFHDGGESIRRGDVKEFARLASDLLLAAESEFHGQASEKRPAGSSN